MEAAIIKPKLPKTVKLRKAFSKLSLFNGPQSPDIHTEGNSRDYELKKMYQFVKNFLSLRCARRFIGPPPCTPARSRRRGG
jgi:hypothetical protein